ncbi:putative NAD(P)/FAD-binding protein YdhS [Rhizobium mesoamericanum]|uniref:FAD/NAD(P)-binding protein n=1 Tax=Rhizobium mesoamericanum TaxID=1079800 RepID=UPI00277D2E50|nr:FAD-dependent oxidoreductase [Rhizobium mesoamericanum]MDQ0561157.1 putative NAD(P)/FAD-binding protein YdhS [Rhizobium mesoamericanum]
MIQWTAVTLAHISLQDRSSPDKRTIAIIGGGFSGAAVAYHLAKYSADRRARIVVFEPREAIGKGTAYDTVDPVHRINVPAAKMSLVPGEPDHFSRWLGAEVSPSEDPQAYRPDGSMYPRRSIFGRYVHANLEPLLAEGRIRHIRSRVEDVRRRGQRWRIRSGDGTSVTADVVVIATSHPAPEAPAALVKALAAHPRFVTDPTAAGTLRLIRPDDRVLIVGNGLTSADVIASLDHQGHRGPVVSLSRRGLRSKGHAPVRQDPFGDFLTPMPERVSELLARIRASIRDAEQQGLTWHAVIDRVRGQGAHLWKALSIEARRRVVRHLRPYWDAHRFRIAPQVERVLDEAVAAGRLEILAAAIEDVDTDGDKIGVSVRRRRQPSIERREFNAIVVTTGPAHGRILSSQDWLEQLRGRGHLHSDPTGLGLSCNELSQALSADLSPDPTLYVAGPLARGQFGELMGLPEVSEHALFVAEQIAEHLEHRAT